MGKSFFSIPTPIIAMVTGDTVEVMKETAAKALADGADGIGFCMEMLTMEERTDEQITDLFRSCGDRPVYATCYRSSNSKGCTDDECVDYMMQCLRCGATLGDVMGDLYHIEPTGMTFDPEAAEKQKLLIEKIHAMGKEVLISTHTKKFLEPEEMLRYALGQQERGTDIIKLVGYAQDEEQLVANMKTVSLFKKELKKPFILLANGPMCKPLRLDGAAKGVCTYLCRTTPEGEQPLVSTAKFWRDEM